MVAAALAAAVGCKLDTIPASDLVPQPGIDAGGTSVDNPSGDAADAAQPTGTTGAPDAGDAVRTTRNNSASETESTQGTSINTWK